jgi:acetylornithine deacetylase/succinyl-diaminopimelate desuccinylase-like protein
MATLEKALEYVKGHREEFLNELKELVSIPSVSTDPDRKTDVEQAAAWLKQRLLDYGAANSRIIHTERHPLVWAEFPVGTEDGASAPSLLIYGHYDVQPADPLELWESDPFDPVERDGRLYGRGASDMKAQVMATLLAVRAAAASGPLPVTIRVMLEGEEEIGSPSLRPAIEQHADILKADVCLNLDTGMMEADVPSIRYGLRGLAYFELAVHGPDHDLHSGHYGGVVHNPIQVLTELIAGMHDQNGTVMLPVFYDKVRAIDATERERLSQAPTTDDRLRELSGAPKLWGEPDFTLAERIGARPTLEINGIWGGYTGEGSKTVIPAEAHAKISMRLVPDQEPHEVRAQLEDYLRRNAPDTVTWELTELAGGDAFICDPSSPAHEAFAAALRDVWRTEPILARIGGSVPVASDVEKLLGMPSILSGFALPDDRIHSPNESQDIDTWYRGIEAVTRFIYRYGNG